jgi:hypothetical protein
VLIDLAAAVGVEMPGFRNHHLSKPFAQLPGDQLPVGVGQLTPQRPRGVEAARRHYGGDAAGQPDLFSNAPTNPVRVHISGELLSNLGLGKPHRLGSLQGRGRGPQLLQPCYPINPGSISHRCAICHRRGQLSQHLIQTRHHRVWRRRPGLNWKCWHGRNTTEAH